MAEFPRTMEELVNRFRNQFKRNPDNAVKAMVTLYAYQTEDEQADGDTKHKNSKGFNAVDAKFLSSLSELAIHNVKLTDKQKAAVSYRMQKYARQIAEHSLATGKIRYEDNAYRW